MDDLERLLAREPAWHPPLEEVDHLAGEPAAPGAPGALLHELRWWRAWAAARRGAWDQVSRLAEEGLGEPWSEREAIRLALLHAISGRPAESEHVLSQAVQWSGDEGMLRRFAAACAAEGLPEVAERFLRISAPPPSGERR